MWESEGGRNGAACGFYKTRHISPCGETVWGLWRRTSTKSCWFAKHEKSGSHRNSAVADSIWVLIPSWSLITEVCVCVWQRDSKHSHTSVVLNIKNHRKECIVWTATPPFCSSFISLAASLMGSMWRWSVWMEDAERDLNSMASLAVSAADRSSLSHHLLHSGMFLAWHAFVFCAEVAVNTLG